jgi:MoaA/NifB/PqqE/SkfB family radical SAM enzyme
VFAVHLQERTSHEPWVGEVDLHEAPTTVAWAVTRARVFSCAHCRADLQRRPDPGELTTDEGYRLLDRLTEFGSPALVLTGGDPSRPSELATGARPLLRGLRDPSRLSGKCGACEFRSVCGGHRGRAYAVTGDVFASDPACAYVPQGWAEQVGE